MTQKRLTPGDLRSIYHFWQDKGDLERFSSWEELKPLVAVEYPELLLAWQNYKMYDNMLTMLTDRMEADADAIEIHDPREDVGDIQKAAAECQAYLRMGALNDALIKEIAHDHKVSPDDLTEEVDWS